MPILEKIISGGQTGADRAALDTAIKFDIPHGGWIPKGRLTEDGPLPEIYLLREMPEPDYPERTRKNILDSEGTVIISRGALTGGSKLTHSFARVAVKPVCHIDLMNQDTFEAALILHSFILENHIRVLNVAGPRASHDPHIHFEVKSIIEAMLYLVFLDSDRETELAGICPSLPSHEGFPGEAAGDLTRAVAMVMEDLSLGARTRIARLDPSRIGDLYFIMVDYIKVRTGLDREDAPLLKRLARGRDRLDYTPEDAGMDVVKALKARLEEEYTLRLVK